MHWILVSILSCIGSVSYTHLDVYKRQGMASLLEDHEHEVQYRRNRIMSAKYNRYNDSHNQPNQNMGNNNPQANSYHHPNRNSDNNNNNNYRGNNSPTTKVIIIIMETTIIITRVTVTIGEVIRTIIRMVTKVTAVSYTHLDVYKRQLQKRADEK